MAKARITERIDIPIDRVWDLIKDFGDLRWSPGATIIKLEGEGPGMIRHVEGGDLGFFKEQCDAIDDGNHTLCYTLLESPAPFEDYRAKIELAEISPGTCEIVWSSEFVPVSVSNADAVKLVEDMYRYFIHNIRSMIEPISK